MGLSVGLCKRLASVGGGSEGGCDVGTVYFPHENRLDLRWLA